MAQGSVRTEPTLFSRHQQDHKAVVPPRVRGSPDAIAISVGKLVSCGEARQGSSLPLHLVTQVHQGWGYILAFNRRSLATQWDPCIFMTR